MLGRKSAVGVCLLIAAALAVGPGSAGAQTTYTCASGFIGFSDSQCRSGGSGFGHVGIAPNTSTSFTLSGGPMKLRSVQSGVTLEIEASSFSGTGTLENKEIGGAMRTTGTFSYSMGFASVVAPPGKGCAVVGGSILGGLTELTNAGLTNEWKLTPIFFNLAEFEITGCSIAALNHAYTVRGSVRGQASGTTTSFGHENVTSQGTLTMSGQKAGLSGSLELRGENGNGLALT